ncbi:hypothetical protein T4E_1236 [Trichinella pseudospiralis]|uniref:Transmembrane protein n=1 Tax=Trichinella pseudospiralis TaxID=6337 RepID=A0A0V0YCV4_TRIPS|nr:hypothetical protein T4E_1236 [Trichinella pseudospiralis]
MFKYCYIVHVSGDVYLCGYFLWDVGIIQRVAVLLSVDFFYFFGILSTPVHLASIPLLVAMCPRYMAVVVRHVYEVRKEELWPACSHRLVGV